MLTRKTMTLIPLLALVLGACSGDQAGSALIDEEVTETVGRPYYGHYSEEAVAHALALPERLTAMPIEGISELTEAQLQLHYPVVGSNLGGKKTTAVSGKIAFDDTVPQGSVVLINGVQADFLTNDNTLWRANLSIAPGINRLRVEVRNNNQLLGAKNFRIDNSNFLTSPGEFIINSDSSAAVVFDYAQLAFYHIDIATQQLTLLAQAINPKDRNTGALSNAIWNADETGIYFIDQTTGDAHLIHVDINSGKSTRFTSDEFSQNNRAALWTRGRLWHMENGQLAFHQRKYDDYYSTRTRLFNLITQTFSVADTTLNELDYYTVFEHKASNWRVTIESQRALDGRQTNVLSLFSQHLDDGKKVPVEDDDLLKILAAFPKLGTVTLAPNQQFVHVSDEALNSLFTIDINSLAITRIFMGAAPHGAFYGDQSSLTYDKQNQQLFLQNSRGRNSYSKFDFLDVLDNPAYLFSLDLNAKAPAKNWLKYESHAEPLPLVGGLEVGITGDTLYLHSHYVNEEYTPYRIQLNEAITPHALPPIELEQVDPLLTPARFITRFLAQKIDTQELKTLVALAQSDHITLHWLHLETGGYEQVATIPLPSALPDANVLITEPLGDQYLMVLEGEVDYAHPDRARKNIHFKIFNATTNELTEVAYHNDAPLTLNDVTSAVLLENNNILLNDSVHGLLVLERGELIKDYDFVQAEALALDRDNQRLFFRNNAGISVMDLISKEHSVLIH